MPRLFTSLLAGLLLALSGRAAVLEGASLLQDPLAEGLRLSPTLTGSVNAWRVGFQGNGQLRNDRLSLSTWNTYAGTYLDDGDKHDLLSKLGSELAGTAQLRNTIMDAALELPGRPGWRAGLLLENVADGAGRLDIALLETLFFGNDPEQPLTIRRAEFAGEVLTRLRGALSLPGRTPAAWPGLLADRPVRWGLGLILERGEAWTRTRSFSGRIEPMVGQLAGRFVHLQEDAGIGFGWGLDLGASLDLELREAPLRVDLALRGLPHWRTWRDVRVIERSFDLPTTTVGTSFDLEAFNTDINDTTSFRAADSFTELLQPGWTLAADWRAAPAWHHSLLAEQAPESAAGKGRRQLSWYSRWSPGGGPWFLGGELAGGMGRGTALGMDLGLMGATWELALGAKGFGGLGNATRGLQTGLSCRWMIR